MSEFEEFYEENPRKSIKDSRFQEFLIFAKTRYIRMGELFEPEDSFNVNWTNCEGLAELDDELTRYIGDSQEALILYDEFMRLKHQFSGKSSVGDK